MHTMCDVDLLLKLWFIIDSVCFFFPYSAIEFYFDEENTLPKKVRYAIRLAGTWSTDSTYPTLTSDGPDRQ